MRPGLLLLCAFSLSAQPPQHTATDLLETTYRLLDDGTGEITQHQRLRALTAQGRDAISKIQIAFASAFEEVEFRSIKTVKNDGTVVEGNPASAFESAPPGNPMLPMFTDTRLKVALAPNFDTGDAVEFEVVRRLRKWPKEGDFWLAHYANRLMPVTRETVVLDLPADRQVAYYEDAATPAQVETANGRRIRRWTLSNPAGTRPSADGLSATFAVSSVTSWDAFGAWIHSLNAHAAEPTPEITALAAKLTERKATAEAKIAALHAFVATKIRYISVSFGAGRIQPHTATEVLHNGYGDCKDQTALLSALLTAAGFKPHAVLTTPGAGVRIRDVPFSSQFTHEFTAVETPSGLVFLDPSLGPAAPQVLGISVRGRSALLIGDTSASLVEIPGKAPVPSLSSISLKGKIGADGAFDGSTRFELQGVPEIAMRRAFLDGAPADKEKLLRQLAGPEFKDAVVRQIQSGDPADLSKPFTVECEIAAREFFPPQQQSMRITFEVVPPALIAMLSAVAKPQNPIPYDASSNRRTMDLIVDTAFTITDRVAVHKKAPFGSFDSEFSYANGHLYLKRAMEMNGTPVQPAEWDQFVDMLRAAQAASAEGFQLSRHAGAPTTGSSPFAEGSAALRRHDYPAAVEAFRRSSQINAREPRTHDALAIAYAGMGEWEQSRAAAARAVELTPEDPTRWCRLGRAQARLGRTQEAVKSFDRALSLVHSSMTENDVAYFMSEAGIQLDRAWKLVSGALDPEARATCEPAGLVAEDQCAPQLRRVAHLLDTAAWVLYRQGKAAEAEPYAASAYAISPSAEAGMHRAILAAKTGRREEALRYYAAARALAPPELRRELASILGGEPAQLPVLPTTTAHFLAFVDPKGKVLDSQGPAEAAAFVKSLSVTPIAWPGHELASLRTIEIARAGDGWTVVRSYVGAPPE